MDVRKTRRRCKDGARQILGRSTDGMSMQVDAMAGIHIAGSVTNGSAKA